MNAVAEVEGSVSTISTGTTIPPFARGYVRSVRPWGGPLSFAPSREGEDRAAGLLAAFLGALEERVADTPDHYRWDYIEALLICRKADGPATPQSSQAATPKQAAGPD